MPFASAKQELYLQINHPDIWKEWRKKYGDAPGYKELLKQSKSKNRRKRKKKIKKTSKRRTKY